MVERLATGVDVLDRQLGGGLPAGSVVAYEAPAASQSELLLYELSQPRDTIYLSTDRTEDAVADAFEASAVPVDVPDVQLLSTESPLDDGRRSFRRLADEHTLILDAANELERTERGRYQTFLNELHNHMRNTGSIAILHCLKSNTIPELREVTEHMADVVFDLTVATTGTDVETRLAAPKLRGGRALDETIKLDLADRVRIDTSRDIA